ncbi:hypothetical protein BIW11_03206 [Tropilaelaps mercedesae]|uniref:Uncharacterized protein n=1 Tax=Tropilaelaps mercedesae TaxID=418985 RepID=A0A1V9XQE3_9ACAR|nr:hypothetical protein BIW11_03206 [Tropilaelaps mercedesae]
MVSLNRDIITNWTHLVFCHRTRTAPREREGLTLTSTSSLRQTPAVAFYRRATPGHAASQGKVAHSLSSPSPTDIDNVDSLKVLERHGRISPAFVNTNATQNE